MKRSYICILQGLRSFKRRAFASVDEHYFNAVPLTGTYRIQETDFRFIGPSNRLGTLDGAD